MIRGCCDTVSKGEAMTTKRGQDTPPLTFITSDPHLGHENILRYMNRPYMSLRDMHDAIIENWNTRVRRCDRVFVIGDWSHGADSLSTSIEIGRKLNGHKVLIAGNHDFDKNGQGKRYGLKDYADVFAEVYTGPLEIKHDGRRYILFHYPMESWNGSTHGTFHLHGHCHGMLPSRTDPSQPMRFGRRLDVGMDVHGMTPLSMTQVEQKIEQQIVKMLRDRTHYHVAVRDGRRRTTVECEYVQEGRPETALGYLVESASRKKGSARLIDILRCSRHPDGGPVSLDS